MYNTFTRHTGDVDRVWFVGAPHVQTKIIWCVCELSSFI
jgi:hypothetical protein